MSDLQKYIVNRKALDPEFADGFDEGYKHFKIGVLLKQARTNAGMTQDEIAASLTSPDSLTKEVSFPSFNWA